MKKLILLFVLVLSLDQGTKYLAEAKLSVGNSVPVISGVFDLTLVYNPGAAFGMFSDWPTNERRFALTVVSILALGVVVWFGRTEGRGDPWFQFPLCAVVAGAAGNMADRMRIDAVVDFLDVYYGNYHWPAFNIADSAISVSVAILLWRMAFGPKLANNPGE